MFVQLKRRTPMSKRAQERRTGRACSSKTEVYLFDFKILNQKQPSSLGVLPMSRDIRRWVRSLFWEAPGNWRETKVKPRSVFSREERKHSGSRKLRETATWCVTVQEVAGNCNVVLKISLKEPGWIYHNMRVSDCQYVEKILENVRQKLRLSSDTRCEE